MVNENYTLAQEYNHQGLILYSKDKYDEAKTYFERAINEDPHYIDSYINMAQIYIVIDEYESAKKWLDKALMINKKCAIAYFHLGNIDLLQNHTEDARGNYAKAVSLGYDNVQIYINLAVDAEERGEMDEAISYYNKAIAIDKFNALAKARKAQVLIALKRFPEALKACDSLIETNPDIFEGYHYKFAVLCDMGKFDDAEKVLDRALQLFPDDDAFFYDKARLYHAQNRLEEALQIIDNKLVFTENNRASLIAFKAEIMLAMGRTDDAQDILLAEYPQSKDGEIAFLLNSIFIAKKEYEQVLVYSQEVLEHSEIDNYYYAALYYHAVALGKLGRKQEADAEYENALKFFRAACSRNPGQLQLYFYRAMCHEELGQYEKALDMVDYLLNVDEGLLEARLIRMKCYEKMGKMTEAEQERNYIELNKPELLKMMEG